MDHYIDLKLRPDPEFVPTQLMSALFAKLHRGLHDLQRSDVGVSFPEVRTTLGSCLRLHGNAAALEQLMALNWLTGMRDHVHISELAPVPANATWRCVSRVQADSNPERTRRRLIKRHGISEEEAAQRIPASSGKHCALPFVIMRSNGSGHTFHLFIRHGPLSDHAQPGAFGAYGLSATSTIPWF